MAEDVGSVVPTTCSLVPTAGAVVPTAGSVVPTASDDVAILEAAMAAPAPAMGCADGDPGGAKSTELFRNLFEKLDLKRDGRIDADELVVGLHNMGYLHLSQASTCNIPDFRRFNQTRTSNA